MKTSKNSVFKTEQFVCKRFVEILSKSTACFFYSTCQSLLKLFSLTGLKTVFFIKAEVTYK